MGRAFGKRWIVMTSIMCDKKGFTNLSGQTILPWLPVFYGIAFENYELCSDYGKSFESVPNHLRYPGLYRGQAEREQLIHER